MLNIYAYFHVDMRYGAETVFEGQLVSELHRSVVFGIGMDVSAENDLPTNRAWSRVAEPLYLAWQSFGQQNAIILILMDHGDLDYFQQHGLTREVSEFAGHHIPVVYLNYRDCEESLAVDRNFNLIYDHNRTVAVVFNRVKFAHIFYIETIRLIERSTAIKCPTVGMILANTTNVQHALSRPGAIEKFLSHPNQAETVSAIRRTFAGIWSLDLERHDIQRSARYAIQDAIAHPDQFILKSNRRTFWGQELVQKLRNLTPSDQTDHFLITKLDPMDIQNRVLWRPNAEPELGDVVSRLTIGGFLLGNVHAGHILHNDLLGHALRTKRTQDEGVEHRVFDSPYLF